MKAHFLIGLTLLSFVMLSCQPAVTAPLANWPTEAFALCPATAQSDPRYKLELFHREDIVHLHQTALVLVDWTQEVTDQIDRTLHRLEFEMTSYDRHAVAIPLTQWVFIRQVKTAEGQIINGRWSGKNRTQTDFIPFHYLESRTYTVEILAPAGQVDEIGVMTQHHTGIVGGVPIWFSPASDPLGCPAGWADRAGAKPPPRATPHIYGYGGRGRKQLAPETTCTQPAEGTLVRGFGCSMTQGGLSNQRHCGGDTPYFHNGWDIDGVSGSMVWAPISGLVETGHDPLRGHFVTITGQGAAEGERHELLHLSTVFVATDEVVSVGEVVAEIGNSGNSYGAHLHWSIWREGDVIDPQTWECRQ